GRNGRSFWLHRIFSPSGGHVQILPTRLGRRYSVPLRRHMAEQQRYRVLKRLAAGGMAEVFVAESAGIEGFKKQVAIKRVLPTLSKNEQFIAMFLDEARLSAHLSHCNVVSVFDIGVGDGAYFIVMEYVDGADLKNVLECQKDIGQQMPVEVAVFIA